MELHVYHCPRGLVFAGHALPSGCGSDLDDCHYVGLLSEKSLWPAFDLIRDEIRDKGYAPITAVTAHRLLYGENAILEPLDAVKLAALFVVI